MADHLAWAGVAVLLLLGPLLLVASVDFIAIWRTRTPLQTAPAAMPFEDFEVLVPIYGSMDYLENVDFLAPYAERVLLCTTSGESPAFMKELADLSNRHGFRVFSGDVDRPTKSRRRATNGVVRDRLVRDGLSLVEAPYVVCIDADTATTRPLGELVASMASESFDVVSVRLVPSSRRTLLARLQGHEYRLAMDLRRILPWLVSGACHAARTAAFRDVMTRHSLFFQGNDVEVGLLAEALGYRVGHVPFEVPTSVPESLLPWLRQRLAWAGGGVRLFVVNPQLALRHPFVWSYGLLIGLCAFPLRWASLLPAGLALLAVAALYLLLYFLVDRENWDLSMLGMPLYALVTSLILVPLGLVWYVRMLVTDRNPGLIRPNRSPVSLPMAAHK